MKKYIIKYKEHLSDKVWYVQIKALSKENAIEYFFEHHNGVLLEVY